MGKTRDGLTPKQMHFCRCVAAGMSQASAYREAFDVTADGKSATHREAASRLMSRADIKARVDALIALKERAIQRKAVSDRELVVGKLRRWVEDGIDPTTGDEPTNAQLAAAQLLGRTVALFSDKQVVEKVERSPDEIAAEIEKRLASAADDQPLH